LLELDGVSVRVEAELNGVRVPLVLDAEALAEIAAAWPKRTETSKGSHSPYMTIVEAAEYLRSKRQRVDDLLSAERLTRIKDGSRTLVARAELEQYLRSNAGR
jgi:excisionase family DNA binding protein